MIACLASNRSERNVGASYGSNLSRQKYTTLFGEGLFQPKRYNMTAIKVFALTNGKAALKREYWAALLRKTKGK